MGTNTSESDLDFISYTYTVSFTNVLENFFEVTIRWNDLSPATLETFRNECANAAIFALTLFADLADFISVQFS